MNPWYAKALVLAASVAMVAIRAPHGQRSRGVPVTRSRRGRLEIGLLTMAWVAFILPLVWIVSPVLSSADYLLCPLPWAAGAALLGAGLWLFHLSHRDLGENWSITLEVREGHRLVTNGLYARVRHPMYLALLVYGIGQALALPNWLAGPSYAAAMLLLIACRLGPEERMMLEAFGEEYEAYRARTKRLVPGVW